MSSKIEWTGETWNPILGCTKVSGGCDNCYAMGAAWMKQHHPNAKIQAAYAGLTVKRNGRAAWTNQVRCLPERLAIPLRWKTPRTIFVNSMSDLFHEDVPDKFIDQIFAVMALCPQHTFQVLTKRWERMEKYMTAEWVNQRVYNAVLKLSLEEMERGKLSEVSIRPAWPLPNVWLGVSVEDQATADERIPHLLNTPAAIRFVSHEPALGPVDFTDIGGPGSAKSDVAHGSNALWDTTLRPRIDWIIVGGESGPNARPMNPDWARSVRDQCAAAAVPFFFKQWGAWEHEQYVGENGQALLKLAPGRNEIILKGGKYPINMRRIGKKAAGRDLDGREYSEMPQIQGAAERSG